MVERTAAVTPSPVSTSLFTLEGTIPPRKTPLAYRAGLALSAMAMVLLPVVYIGLIGATGYGVYAYARAAAVIFEGSGGGLWRLIIYVGPIVAGVIVIAFMIKPLFAASARPQAPATLDLNQQPQLRALIAAVCAKVGAPMPVRVDVDCDVNASAQLRRGLLSLGRKDLVLTIGLPLVAGLNARQLAGVLAHEFGHFAQGAGMAFTYVIRWVNNWFARVVFERDTWDEALAAWSRELDFRVGVIFWIARGAVWVSRKILHGLMLVGHAIACLQLRQMEYDADYYETQVAGSDAFVETSRELTRLGLGGRVALGELADLWRDRRLVDDFPGFVLRRRIHLAREIDAKVAEHENAPTRWFDTHPSNRDREAHARGLNLPGLFQGDAPASALFHQFGELCREATTHYYREALELEYEPNAILETAAAARGGDEAAEGREALRRSLGSALNLNRPVLWTEADFKVPIPSPDPAALHAELARVRSAIGAPADAAQAADQAFNERRAKWVQARVAREMLLQKLPINPASFDLPSPIPTEVDAHVAKLDRAYQDVPPVLATYDQAVHRWVALVVAITRFHRESLPETLVADVEAAARWLIDFRPWLRAFPQWESEYSFFEFAVQFERALDEHRNYRLLGEHVEKMRAVASNAPSLVEGLGWPLAPAHAPRSVAAQFSRTIEGLPPAQHLVIVLKMTGELYFRAVGRLAARGEELERILAASELA